MSSRHPPGQVGLASRASAKGGCTCTNCWEVEPLAEFREKMQIEVNAAEKVAAVGTTAESNIIMD